MLTASKKRPKSGSNHCYNTIPTVTSPTDLFEHVSHAKIKKSAPKAILIIEVPTVKPSHVIKDQSKGVIAYQWLDNLYLITASILSNQ